MAEVEVLLFSFVKLKNVYFNYLNIEYIKVNLFINIINIKYSK